MGTADTTARMTVTLPGDLYAEVEARISRDGVGNRSRFVAEALRTHLHHLRHQDMTDEAAQLDVDEELSWAVAPPPEAPNPTHAAPPGPAST